MDQRLAAHGHDSRAAGDVGGVGGPVSGGGSLPLDGDGDAEGAGEDRAGQFGCELE